VTPRPWLALSAIGAKYNDASSEACSDIEEEEEFEEEVEEEEEEED
jgi:hypothetical protein